MSRPRIRSLKPEMWQDEHVGRLSIPARVLMLGLITMADDEGRLRAVPRLILGHVFPYDDLSEAKLERLLAELDDAGIVLRYEQNGVKYAALRNWARHQRINRPKPSTLPEPPDPIVARENAVNVTDSSVTHHGQDSDDSSLPRGSDPIPSPSSAVDVEEPQADVARDLFDFWREQCGKRTAKFTADRRRRITARLAEGYTPEQIADAIRGAAAGAYVNPDTKVRYDDLELICRSGSKLESFIARAQVVPGREGVSDIDDWLKGRAA